MTTMQIIQMVTGISVVLKSQSCRKYDPLMFYTSIFMYVSYAILFAKLFSDKYLAPKKEKKNKDGEKKQQ